MLTSIFNLQKVKCAGCVNKIQSKLNQLAEVNNARVNLLDKTLVVDYHKYKSDELIISMISELGYIASLDEIAEDKVILWRDVFLPIMCATILMLMTMQQVLFIDYRSSNGFALGIVYAVISLTVVGISGRKQLVSGIQGFFHLNLNMYSLVVLGVCSAWLYSLWVVVISRYSEYMGSSHVYFDAALMIIAIINLGAYLEAKATSSATSAIRSLAELVPDITTVIIDGSEQVLATNLLRTDDLVKIRAGDKIPCDGEITLGNGTLNESMLSGESLPIEKQIGDRVIGGSINLSGSFIFKVTAIGENTFLSNIITLVKNAGLAKPKLVELADKIVKIFVPLVILIALSSALIWYFLATKYPLYSAISVFMSVLLIACPCSVGLAIPVSLVVGLGRGAKQGILMRDTSCLSNIDKLGVVLLDKTGTITEGVPRVVHFTLTDNCADKTKLLQIVSMIEAHSNHPLASAIIDYCDSNSLVSNIENFQSYDGKGLSAIVDGVKYYLGAKGWITEFAVANSSLIMTNDYSQVYVATDKEIVARFDIADMIKADSKRSIDKIKSLGVQVYMVTGDNQQVAKSIANQVGIDKVFASCLPQDKLKIVTDIQQRGIKVAFVGDGINDAPSLLQADIGIAIGGGLDIAKQSASISLVGHSLNNVYDALRLARNIQLNMRQNLYGSFIYNSIAISVAAGLFYPLFGVLLNPMIASITMSMSSLCVILNALRLRFVMT